MPQLDELSFSTQYIWLTIFFWSLYFLVVNFFVVNVFKALRVRLMVNKYWNNFVYNFSVTFYINLPKKYFFKIVSSPFLFVVNKLKIYRFKTNSSLFRSSKLAVRGSININNLEIDEL